MFEHLFEHLFEQILRGKRAVPVVKIGCPFSERRRVQSALYS